jgi:putative protease
LHDLRNGDGLCFFTKYKKLSGFRVERIEDSKIFPNTMKDLAKGVSLYRNRDNEFTHRLQRISGRRWINVEIDFRHDGDTVRLAAQDEDGNRVDLIFHMPYEEPRNPSMAREQIEKHLSSTGATVFKVTKINISRRFGFFSIGFLNGIRRQILADLTRIRLDSYPAKKRCLLLMASLILKSGWIITPTCLTNLPGIFINAMESKLWSPLSRSSREYREERL